MCGLEDVYHSCGHWGAQRFIDEPCIRSRTVSGHTLPCDYKETNGMANSKDLCSACKRASLATSEFAFESCEPLFPPASDSGPSSRSGSVSSAISEWSIVESIDSVESTASTRPVIRLKRLMSNGKIHWVSSVSKGLNWYWFGRRSKSESDIQG